MAKIKMRSGVKSLSANGQDTLTINFPKDFQLLELTYKATSASVKGKIRITDDDEYFVGTAVSLDTIFGTGERPRMLSQARLIKASSQMVLELTDTSGSTNEVQIVLLGHEA